VAQNVDLWQQSLNHIHDYPHEWYQGDYGVKFECGTAYCLFGTAVQLKSEENSTVRFRWDGIRADYNVINIGKYGSEVTNIVNYVSELFGITISQGLTLSHGANTMAEIFALSYVLTEQEIKLPDEVFIVLRGKLRPSLFMNPATTARYEIQETRMNSAQWDQEIARARGRLLGMLP
jgi:hypothetical protein